MCQVPEAPTGGVGEADGAHRSLDTTAAALTRNIQELALTNEELVRSRQRIVGVEESARKEIARRLHGSIQNRLNVLVLRLTQLKQSVPAGSLATELEDLVQQIAEPMERDLQSITHQLYPLILRLGLVPSLQTLCDLFENAISLDLDEELVRQERENRALLQDQVKLAAYRIVEEAIDNAVKHSKASRIVLRLELTVDGQLRIAVRDNGCGFDVAIAEEGLGISSINDYAEVVGGVGAVYSTAGNGTEVVATIPLNEAGEDCSSPAISSD